MLHAKVFAYHYCSDVPKICQTNRAGLVEPLMIRMVAHLHEIHYQVLLSV